MKKKPAKTKPKGFFCPNCAVRLRVIVSRGLANACIKRRRECPTCPFRITTEEKTRARA